MKPTSLIGRDHLIDSIHTLSLSTTASTGRATADPLDEPGTEETTSAVCFLTAPVFVCAFGGGMGCWCCVVDMWMMLACGWCCFVVVVVLMLALLRGCC